MRYYMARDFHVTLGQKSTINGISMIAEVRSAVMSEWRGSMF